ncbi:GDSL lipase/esterase [Phascolomyces articulosus]|uniref:GDSL lipase/esterase n=1 Tax=Phascolomyces articulosus TaxID=60185 RepID=A0AAD5K684_9FUNG|nr:GDSL lipase/esterase [Phascolomyces articulosus]
MLNHSNNKTIGLFLLVLSVLASLSSALTASSIADCPALPARSGPAGVHDLRPDDIKVVAALGDSIMAGFALEGINDGPGGTGILNLSAITEFRGKSWGIGGDDGAITLANFVKHYNSSLEGPAVGKHLVFLCGDDENCNYRHPDIDILNAAISGGIAKTLNAELDYLIPRMMQLPNVNFATDWKMITIQIGSNDQCASCGDNTADVTVEAYGNYVEAAIERIRSNVPRVIVNLVGTFNVSGVYDLTMGQEYCRPLFNQPDWILNRILCECFRGSEEDRANMDTLSAQYSAKLHEIYQKYNAQQHDGFAIAYTPATNLNIGGLPLETLSNVDCFHPGIRAHEWVSKIYCPTEDDRIRID